VSANLGHAFTGNGDVLGIGYNNDQEINGIGYGDHPPAAREPVGPTITGVIDLRNQTDVRDGMVVEDGAIPGPLAPLMPAALANAAHLFGVETAAGTAELERKRAREMESLLQGPYHGAARNTQVYLAMSHDSGDGVIVLENDRIRVAWPGIGAAPIFKKANEMLEDATRPLEGTYVRNPAWSGFTHNNLITVHPLGGCVMGANAQTAVVNHKGQVFSGESGTEAYEGLYVCDGAVVPLALGVNPFLTISALAERMCALLAQDRGWQIDYHLPLQPQTLPTP
jgi:cholesterol oxidase